MRSHQNDAPPLAPATVSEGDGVRYLHLDSIWVQGAMRIGKPHELELAYIQRMMAWLLWRPTAEMTQGEALQLGLGAAALTRFCALRLQMPTTVVEINPSVIDACHLWFRLPRKHERIRVVNADAGRWLQHPEHHGRFAALQVDLYDHEAAAPVLDSDAFYAGCQQLLAPGGLMAVNLFGRASSFAQTSTRIAAAFGADQVWSLQPTKEGNTIVIAARGVEVPDRDELSRRAAHIEAQWRLPARKWLRMVRPLA